MSAQGNEVFLVRRGRRTFFGSIAPQMDRIFFDFWGREIGRIFMLRGFENRLESRTCGGRFCAVLEFERLSGLGSENRPFRGILWFFKSFIKSVIKIKIKSY